MKRSGESAMWLIAWVIGGFVLSVLALFSLFGAYILAALLVAATPFVLGFLVLDALFGKRPVYVTSAKAEEQPLPAPPEEAPARRLSVRVIRARGTCPLGYQFNVGNVWVLDGKAEGAGAICPTAREMLSGYVERMRRGELAPEERATCRSNGHMVEFELKPEEIQSLAIT